MAGRAVADVRWFHTIELPGGVVTPGVSDPREQLPKLRLPDRLDGLSVLDVGAWDGFFSFECERRGAARVLATDSFSWRASEGGATGRAGFDLAREALGSSVEDLEIDVMELSPERVGGRFDVVLFLGVLYHLRDPLAALERVASVCGELLVLETHVDLVGTRRPAAAFYPGEELDGDWTNWWGPNPAAVTGMLRAAGFTRVEQVFPRGRAYAAARALKRLTTERSLTRARQGRAAFHARR